MAPTLPTPLEHVVTLAQESRAREAREALATLVRESPESAARWFLLARLFNDDPTGWERTIDAGLRELGSVPATVFRRALDAMTSVPPSPGGGEPPPQRTNLEARDAAEIREALASAAEGGAVPLAGEGTGSLAEERAAFQEAVAAAAPGGAAAAPGGALAALEAWHQLLVAGLEGEGESRPGPLSQAEPPAAARVEGGEPTGGDRGTGEPAAESPAVADTLPAVADTLPAVADTLPAVADTLPALAGLEALLDHLRRAGSEVGTSAVPESGAPPVPDSPGSPGEGVERALNGLEGFLGLLGETAPGVGNDPVLQRLERLAEAFAGLGRGGEG